jgi:hypothetical protein
MPKALSAQQIVGYRADGFITPLDALSEAEVNTLRHSLARTEAHVGGSLMAIYSN